MSCEAVHRGDYTLTSARPLAIILHSRFDQGRIPLKADGDSGEFCIPLHCDSAPSCDCITWQAFPLDSTRQIERCHLEVSI